MTGSTYILPDSRKGIEICRRGSKIVVLVVHESWPFPSNETQEYSASELQRIDHDPEYEEARW